jgi:hypothetical protein
VSRKSKAAVRLIAPRGRPHIECPKCRATVVWPSKLTPTEASAFAEVSRRSTLDGARYAHEKLGLDLREAKALAFHVTRTKGFAINANPKSPARNRCVPSVALRTWIGDQPAGLGTGRR